MSEINLDTQFADMRERMRLVNERLAREPSESEEAAARSLKQTYADLAKLDSAMDELPKLRAESERLKSALRESNSLLAAIIHERRDPQELMDQITENNAALKQDES